LSATLLSLRVIAPFCLAIPPPAPLARLPETRLEFRESAAGQAKEGGEDGPAIGRSAEDTG
jgi:hypothetical protein